MRPGFAVAPSRNPGQRDVQRTPECLRAQPGVQQDQVPELCRDSGFGGWTVVASGCRDLLPCPQSGDLSTILVFSSPLLSLSLSISLFLYV